FAAGCTKEDIDCAILWRRRGVSFRNHLLRDGQAGATSRKRPLPHPRLLRRLPAWRDVPDLLRTATPDQFREKIVEMSRRHVIRILVRRRDLLRLGPGDDHVKGRS